eukprot:COSAG01_NODE_1269_length_10964_cov_1152.442798_6_plen_238_part_00
MQLTERPTGPRHLRTPSQTLAERSRPGESRAAVLRRCRRGGGWRRAPPSRHERTQPPISPTDASARQTRTHTTPWRPPHRPDRGAHLGYDPIPMTSCKTCPYPPGCSTSARGTTPPLSFQEGYRWGPFPAGGSRYPFVVLPERHICGLLIRDKNCRSCPQRPGEKIDQNTEFIGPARKRHLRFTSGQASAQTQDPHHVIRLITHHVTSPSRLPIADLENFAARRVESAWLAETGAAP